MKTMRYCYHCNRITTGAAFFCNFCGRSYDVKLCPRLHANPRTAEVCSQCGSRDLSTPEPQAPMWARLLEKALHYVPGILLLAVTVLFAIAFLHAVLTNPDVLGQFLVLALVLGFVWYLYTKLPSFVRKGIHKGLRKGSKRNDDRHG